MEAQIARGEVELLVVGRIIRNMHLTIDACNGAVFLKHDSRVMIKSCSTTLKERSDDHHTKLLGEFAIEPRRRSGDGLCEVEVVYIFHLTEIQGVVKLL